MIRVTNSMTLAHHDSRVLSRMVCRNPPPIASPGAGVGRYTLTELSFSRSIMVT